MVPEFGPRVHGFVETGATAGASQLVACYICVVNDEAIKTPQVYVMINGTSYCLDHAKGNS